MNLADAIRQAAYGGGPLVPETPQQAPHAAPAPAQPRRSKPKKSNGAADVPATFEEQVSGHPTMVRMELFLSPEQMNALFKAVVATHHSVMTLREAASYLRINPASLEQLAQDGEIAAFMVDGRWRFPKSGLDEWVALNTFRKEDADAA